MVCIIRSEPSAEPVLWVGVILAESERCLWPLAGRPILDRVVERARLQVSSLIVATPHDPARFAGTGLPAIRQGFPGPAGAILTGFAWAAAHVKDAPWVATFAAEAPFVPDDLVGRLGRAIGEKRADMACVTSNGMRRWTFGLWPVRLRRSLHRAMVGGNGSSLEAWSRRHRLAEVPYSAEPDPFFAIGRPADLATAEKALLEKPTKADS